MEWLETYECAERTDAPRMKSTADGGGTAGVATNSIDMINACFNDAFSDCPFE